MARGIINETNIKISPVNVEHRKNLDIRAGDTVRVSVKVVEKGKTRLQAFEGIILSRKHGSEPGATFTVRKTASGVGVERIFPLYSPNIDKVELIKRAKTRRSKLYYIREKAAKEIRKKMKALRIDLPDLAEKEEVVEEAPAEAETAEGVAEATEEVKEEVVVKEKVEEVKEEEKPTEEVKEEESEKKE
ncbi:50S ribosomal protein L19 [Patescibacteria group bacterium]